MARLSASSRHSKAPTVVEVFTLLGYVFEMTFDELEETTTHCTQPWAAPSMFLESTKYECVCAAVLANLPAKLDQPLDYIAWSRHVDFVHHFLCFDMASSNVSTYAGVLDLIDAEAPGTVALHGERCSIHNLHKIRSTSLGEVSLQSMLFSLSNILGQSRNLDAVRENVYSAIKSNLRVLYNDPPSTASLLDQLCSLLDLTEEDTHVVNKDGQRRALPWSADLCTMVETSHFDRRTGEWLYYAGRRRGVFMREQVDTHSAAVQIADPILTVLIGRRWERPSENRWTAGTKCLKRAVVGIVWNRILCTASARLRNAMRIDERAAQAEVAAKAARVAKGLEEDDDYALKK